MTVSCSVSHLAVFSGDVNGMRQPNGIPTVREKETDMAIVRFSILIAALLSFLYTPPAPTTADQTSTALLGDVQSGSTSGEAAPRHDFLCKVCR